MQQSTAADALLPISEDVEMPIVELAPVSIDGDYSVRQYQMRKLFSLFR